MCFSMCAQVLYGVIMFICLALTLGAMFTSSRLLILARCWSARAGRCGCRRWHVCCMLGRKLCLMSGLLLVICSGRT
ncbi:hypothetical protein GCK32_002804 [Trichostrongylus colubriformis]|uniref:Uncharacterized protein n=1 Tax=Trichostrongylus colubriformis TaxID=6319 RepID=A0AAN8FE17_TRICO